MYNGLDSFLSKFCSIIYDAIRGYKRIMVITHTDADGLVSGSILTKAIVRARGRCLLRCVSDLTPNVLASIADEAHDLYIFTDLGAGLADTIDEHIGKSRGKEWLVIDHHQLPEHETHDDRVCNAWKFNIDGGKEACAGTMAYKVAYGLDPRNEDLSALAVVSMVADRQDQGERKSLLGLNLEVAETARRIGLLSIDMDIMVVGRETRAIHEALAYTSYPYIDGLTWNVDAYYSLLTSTGLRLKDDGRWRTIAELNSEEKSMIIDAIARYTSINNSRANTIVDELIGYVYTLVREDKKSMLRDAREFSNLLNACARIGKPGVGIAVCLGDRGSMLKEGESIVNEYRKTLRHYITSIMNNERWRINDYGGLVVINGDALIAQDMLGAVSSLLSGAQIFQGKVLVVKTNANDGTYKFSARKCINCNIDVNLGILMRECSSKCNGTGGGHDAAAGARISANMLDEFMECIKKAVIKQ